MDRKVTWLCGILLCIASGCKQHPINPAFQGGVNEKYVYVIGETLRGDMKVPYEPGMTVVDLIAERGGITTRGISGSVKVYRPSKDQTLHCKINYDHVKEGDAKQNIVLQGGDIVYIPKTITAAIYDGFKAIFPPWNDMVGAGTRMIEVYEASKATK